MADVGDYQWLAGLFSRTPEYLAALAGLPGSEQEGAKDLEVAFMISVMEMMRVGSVPGVGESGLRVLRNFLRPGTRNSIEVTQGEHFLRVRRDAPAFVLFGAGLSAGTEEQRSAASR
jgi:hypothetical protein